MLAKGVLCYLKGVKSRKIIWCAARDKFPFVSCEIYAYSHKRVNKRVPVIHEDNVGAKQLPGSGNFQGHSKHLAVSSSLHQSGHREQKGVKRDLQLR
jgi:hypothetical protein